MKNVESVSGFANKNIEKVAKMTNEASEKPSKDSQQVVSKVGKKREQLKTAEQRLLKESSKYVRKNPISSVSIALGVGFLVSKWLSNR